METCLQKENMEVIDRNMTENVKSKFKEYQKKNNNNKKNKKKKNQAAKNKRLIFFFSIKRSEKILCC